MIKLIKPSTSGTPQGLDKGSVFLFSNKHKFKGLNLIYNKVFI